MQAIVDAANAETAELRNEVVGTQQFDIRRDPARLSESAMGNLVADAMRGYYPGVEAALTNSGGLRADIIGAPPSATEAVNEITWGEAFAVLPFGNRTVILTLTGAQLRTGADQRVLAGLQPGHRHWPVPAGVGARADVLVLGHHGGGHRDVEGPGRGRWSADADRSRRHRAHRDQRLHGRRR